MHDMIYEMYAKYIFKLDQFLYVIYDVDLTSFVDSSYFWLSHSPWPFDHKNKEGFKDPLLSFNGMFL